MSELSWVFEKVPIPNSHLSGRSTGSKAIVARKRSLAFTGVLRFRTAAGWLRSVARPPAYHRPSLLKRRRVVVVGGRGFQGAHQRSVAFRKATPSLAMESGESARGRHRRTRAASLLSRLKHSMATSHR